MSRETKVGLVVAVSFVCLVGVVVASRMRRNADSIEGAQVAQVVSPQHDQPVDKKETHLPKLPNAANGPPVNPAQGKGNAMVPPPVFPVLPTNQVADPLGRDWTKPMAALSPPAGPPPPIRMPGQDMPGDDDMLNLLKTNVAKKNDAVAVGQTALPGKPAEPPPFSSGLDFPAPPLVPQLTKETTPIPPPQDFKPPVPPITADIKNPGAGKLPTVDPPPAVPPLAGQAPPPAPPPVGQYAPPAAVDLQPKPPAMGAFQPTNPGIPPMGAEKRNNTPQASAAPMNVNTNGPKVTNSLMTTFTCSPQETSFADVSTRVLGSPRYGRAIQEFNRTSPVASENLRQGATLFQPNQKVIVPSKDFLEQRYASLIDNRPAPNQVTPAVSIGTPPNANVPAATNGFTAIGRTPNPAPIVTNDATKPYRVPQQGQMLIEIAQQTLGDRGRWSEIYRLNPTIRPEFPVPGGSEIRLPANANVP